MLFLRLVLLVTFLVTVRRSGATPIYAGADSRMEIAQQISAPRVGVSLLRVDPSPAGPSYLPDGPEALIVPTSFGQAPAGSADEQWGRAYARWPSLLLAAIALAAVALAWRGEREEEPAPPRRLRRVYVVR